MRRTAALIVGGGPAGSAAAITLARGGIMPELVERTEGPHDVVCGGFLGWDALAALDGLGVDAGALGARPITRLRLVGSGRQVEATLPKRAAGLSRRTLDEALLAAAARAGAVVTRGRTVRAMDAEARSVRLDDGAEIAADALFLATGKHELRGAARPLDDHPEPLSVGLRMALPADARLRDALAGVIELHLFDGGYAGLLLQEDGTANLCFSFSKPRVAAAGGADRLLEEVAREAPLLGQRMSGTDLSERQAIAGVPYGWRARATAPGLFRLGDQAAVISSLAGDGVAIALTSGREAASAMLAGALAPAAEYQTAFARRSALPLRLANALRCSAESARARPALMRLARLPSLPGVAARLTRIS